MPDTKLYYEEIPSPVGPLFVMSDGENVVRIDYGTHADLDVLLNRWAMRYFTKPVFIHAPERILTVKQQFAEYFAGDRVTFTFKFAFHGTAFQKQVWQALFQTIPYGETRTYQDIAREIQNPKAVRAVGGAVNKNPFSIVVPCHRVIGKNGTMVGYNGGLDKKRYLLNHEQIRL